MNVRGAAPPPPPEARAELLEACRDLAVTRLSHAVTAVMEKADDALFDMADKAETNNLQNLYFDAMREVRLKRPAMEAEFEMALQAGFEQEAPPPGSPQSRDLEASELGLVDMDDLEVSLAVDNMAAKLREEATDIVRGLELRMAEILGGTRARRDNPLGPEAVCSAFRAGCEQIESGIQVKLIVLKLFDRYALDDVIELYQAVDALLLEAGILPELPQPDAVTRRREDADQPADAGPEEAAADVGDGYAAEADPGGAGGAGGDILATLQQLLTSRAQAGSGFGRVGGFGPAAGTVPGGVPGRGAGMGGAGMGGAGGGGSREVVLAGGLLPALTGLQQGHAAAGALLEGVQLPPAGGGGSVNLLHGLRAAGVMEGQDPGAALTLDVVALMFDYILDDDAMPPSVKAQLARLQIPVLKVAILDRALFSSRSHPARRLVDVLAAAGIGLGEDERDDQSLLARIESSVDRVVREFEEDLRVFAEVLEDFEAFLADELARAESHAEQLVAVEADRERTETATARAEAEIARRLAREGIPRVVRGFLDGPWRQVLERTWLASGERGGPWKLDVETMDILLWSLVPKSTAAERRRLLGLLPELLRRINDGVRRGEVPEAERKAFVTAMAAYHAQAVKPAGAAPLPATPEDAPLAGYAAPAPAPQAEASQAPAEAAPAPAAADEVESRAAAKPPPPHPAYVERARNLAKGTWVELADPEGATQRVRLTWVSSISGKYLFTNHQGLKVADRTLDQLARELEAGSARTLDDEPLFDRAVSGLMDMLAEGAA